MRKEKAYSVILPFVIIIAMIFSGCSEPQPEDVVRKLETAFNNSDIDMMIECYEPSVQKMYKATMEIGGQMLGGVDLATIMSGLGGFADVFGSEFGYEMPTIEFVINSKEVISDDKVKLNVTEHYNYKNTETNQNDSNSKSIDIYLVKIDGTWYISAKNF